MLISQYEAMSHKGTVGFIEETVFHRIISHYRQGNRPDQAISAVDHALDQHPYFADFYLLKAQILFEKGCRQLALDCLSQAELFAPESLESSLLRAEILISLEHNEEAFALLERLKLVANSAEELSEVYFCEACVYEFLEQFDQMFFALRQAMHSTPRNKSALKRLWYSVELSKRYKESIRLHEFLIDRDPYCHICWYNLGHAHFCLGKFQEAADAFEYAYLIDANFSSAYKDCAESYLRMGNFSKALNCYEDALEQVEADYELYVKLGYCYDQLHDPGMAQAFYLKAISANPLDDAAYYQMGQSLASQCSWTRAITYYHKAIELNDCFEEYMAALATAYHQTEQNEEAQKWFLQAAETAPEQANAWIQYASFLLDIGHLEEALLCLEDACSFAGGVELLYGRAAVLLLMGHRKQGLSLLNQALQDDYDKRDALFDMAPELESDEEVQIVFSIYRR
ncbi:MAG: tetratricopeptide repeat protein [Bacteroidota bacterium]